MKSSRGHSLTELMITVAIVGILGVGVASAFTFGANQFALLQGENEAETSVLQAAYYLRLFMSNAVKVQCMGGTTTPTPITNNIDITTPNPVIGNVIPLNVPGGYIDCRTTASINPVGTNAGTAWPSNQASLLGIFYREDSPSLPASPNAINNPYQGVGVYYQGPDGNDQNMGVLIFSTQSGAGTVSSTANNIFIDHISNIQIQNVVAPTVLVNNVPYFMVQSITYQITARFFRNQGTVRSFNPFATPSPNLALTRDVVSTVVVPLHNNFLGTDPTNSVPTTERLNGGIYFYKFMAPTSILF